MRSVGELVAFLRECPNGASISEIISRYPEVKKSLIQKFINSGVEDERIDSVGSGRGTRYCVKGATLDASCNTAPPPLTKEQIEKYANAEFQRKIDEVLLSPKPANYITLTNVTQFGEMNELPKELYTHASNFLNAGVLTEYCTITFDEQLAKNVIVEKKEVKEHNMISIKNDGKYIITCMLAGKLEKSSHSFRDYEDLRETLRIFLGA